MTEKSLTTIPAVRVWSDGKSIIFDRKFYDGMLMYMSNWQGSITCIMRSSSEPLPDFGVVRKLENEIPFGFLLLPEKEKISYAHLKNSSVVLVAGDSFENFYISELCQKNKIKCVYTIELIPETRYQINNFQTNNIAVKLRRNFYIWNGERKRVAAFEKADGIQANGTAAYEEYKKFKKCLLYFDTRVYRNTIINDQELNRRLSNLTTQSQPLRLAFSGRLIKIKGVDHLITLASSLKSLSVNFHMSIYGSGDLEAKMRTQISDMQVNDQVSMMGAVDFYNELLPNLKANIDLAVLLHRQGDPSCTYLETLSCGIPIVGYKNKAFSGLLDRADIGWGANIDDIHGIAKIIEHINNNRDIIHSKSKNCVDFSSSHDFERTFRKRIEHLSELVAQ